LAVALLAALLGAIGVPLVGDSAGGQTTGKDPVIIVAGTTSPAIANEPLAARLRARGYQVWIFVLPNLGLQDIRDTSAALNSYADSVRAQTGKAKVDLIGHSQGGLVGRYYIKYLGGADEVDSMISLGAPHYGTATASIATFLGFGSCLGITACEQMSIGSSFLNDLNAGDDTIGNVQYTNISTIYDELVIPYSNAFLANDGNNKNVKVQSQCWLRFVGHVGLILDGAVADGVLDALAHQTVSLNCWAL
jgi:triacylglycerol esterase/lipase EstA (alpha/beta hydrolase family)